MLGSLILCFKGMRTIMFQLYGFYYSVCRMHGFRVQGVQAEGVGPPWMFFWYLHTNNCTFTQVIYNHLLVIVHHEGFEVVGFRVSFDFRASPCAKKTPSSFKHHFSFRKIRDPDMDPKTSRTPCYKQPPSMRHPVFFFVAQMT